MCPMFGLAEATLAVSGSRPSEPVYVEWVDREALESRGDVQAVSPEDPAAKALVSCGHPVPGIDVLIVGEDGTALPDGRVGEICVRGPSTMLGYWRDPDATADAVRGEWLHTGDLGYMGANGLVVCGRMKDMIILGGRNYYPEDYEYWTEQVEGVRKGNVIAFAVPERERMVVVAETTSPPEDAEGIATGVMHMLRRKLGRGPEEVVLIARAVRPSMRSGAVTPPMRITSWP
jgi:fatty-acyl-CoA synthase